MKSFFLNDEAVAKLLNCGGLWKDTPWAANSAALGFGVSCHNLPIEMYKHVGALPKDFPPIIGNPTQLKHATFSLIEKKVDACANFRRLAADEKVMVGDLLGIRIYRHVDHLGIMLTNGFFEHVLIHKRTCVDDSNVSPWKERIQVAWRIEV